MPTNIWRIWRAIVKLEKMKPQGLREKTKNTTTCQKTAHEWLWLYHCYIVLKIKQLYTISISPPRFFFCAKKNTTSTWRGEVKGSQQKFKDSKGIGPYPGGFLPIPIPPLRDFSTFWGQLPWWLIDGFHFPFFSPSTNKPTWLTCGSGNLPNFEGKSEEEGSLQSVCEVLTTSI